MMTTTHTFKCPIEKTDSNHYRNPTFTPLWTGKKTVNDILAMIRSRQAKPERETKTTFRRIFKCPKPYKIHKRPGKMLYIIVTPEGEIFGFNHPRLNAELSLKLLKQDTVKVIRENGTVEYIDLPVGSVVLRGRHDKHGRIINKFLWNPYATKRCDTCNPARCGCSLISVIKHGQEKWHWQTKHESKMRYHRRRREVKVKEIVYDLEDLLL